MLDLVGLPQDVLALIMSFIPSKEDLRCVYLTCKALYSVAIVPLYRHMLLRARSNSMQLMAALNSENVGLRHIRHVTIDVADAARPHLNNCIVLLANLLPRDILLTLTCVHLRASQHVEPPNPTNADNFRLDCNDPLAKDSLQTLWQRQRNLRTRRIDQAAFPLSSTCDGSFRNITTLQMVISNVDTAKACSHIMQQTPGLQVLEIRADPNGYSKEALNIELEDTVAASKDIIHWVFHELAPDKQIRLRALTIYELDFETAASRLIEAVDMTGLDSLGLQNCYNIVNLLRSISAAGAPLRMAMHSLTIVGRLEEAEGRNDDAIDDFLGSFTGLKCLVIAASAQEALRPKLESLSKHAASLEVLYLDCVWNQLSGSLLDEHYNALELRRFLQRCDRLEQLVLNPPEMIFDDLPRHVNFETKDFAAGYHVNIHSRGPANFDRLLLPMRLHF